MATEQHVGGAGEPPASAGGSSAPAAYLTFAAVVGFVMALIWGMSGGGYFWPRWVWFGVGAPAAFWLAIRRARRLPDRGERRFATVTAIFALLGVMMVVIWWFARPGYFWPMWPLAAYAAIVGLYAMVHYGVRGLPWRRERQLTERVEELTRTRRGALNVQAAELRRIERDLHDGAQARLVALSMKLGRAEERLDDQPELAELVRQARIDAAGAIAELRDLARGIAPPVLADRGLAAAVDALGGRAPMPVVVESRLEHRLTPVVETAAYFVAAESLTNVAKHAPATSAHVSLAERGGRLVVEVSDDGPGGADPEGSGLTGLRRRVEALDGTLDVASPPGQGTTVRAAASMRVVIVEDNALLREGLVAMLREREIDVAATAEDGPGLVRIVGGHRPDLAIVDVRLPPTFTDEGVRAAIEARARHQGLGVLILSQYVEPVYTQELLASGGGGVGYLLKERVGEVRTFIEAVERVAAGGTALDREVVAQLMGSRTDVAGEPRLESLSPREREVLELVAEGRTNAAIARTMVITPGAVEKHISNIFAKLSLPASDDDHRRVLAVLAFLQAE